MTLIEIIVVMVLLGLVATVIDAATIAVLKVSPATAFRIEDARSTRGLQTWLVRDVASTPPQLISMTEPEGYVFAGTDPVTVGAVVCGGNAATMIIHMAWTETSDNYSATYHFDNGRIVRSLCGTDNGQIRLTSGVSTTPCASEPFSKASLIDSDGDPDTIDSVEFCLRSLEADSGLNAGGGATQEIRLTVSSRNRTT